MFGHLLSVRKTTPSHRVLRFFCSSGLTTRRTGNTVDGERLFAHDPPCSWPKKLHFVAHIIKHHQGGLTSTVAVSIEKMLLELFGNGFHQFMT